MFQRLLTCLFVGLSLAWLAVWLEFNAAPHPVQDTPSFRTVVGRGDRWATCYGWPSAMYFDAPLTQIFNFETDFRGLTWWEHDRVAWNVLTLVAGWLLIGFSWNCLHSLVQSYRLSLRQCSIGMAVIGVLLAVGRNQYESGVQTAAFVQEVSEVALVANTLPEYLVPYLPAEYRGFQLSIVGLDWVNGHGKSLQAKWPSGQRVRFLTIDQMEEQFTNAVEPNCLRVLTVCFSYVDQPYQALFSRQANLRCLCLTSCSLQITLPVAMLRQLEALELNVSTLGAFAEEGGLPNVRLLSLNYTEGFEHVVREFPRMPHLTHIDLTPDREPDDRVQELLDMLAPCAALVEATLFVDRSTCEQIFTWAERRPLECVTCLYRRHTALPSFSNERLRAALATHRAAVWILQKQEEIGLPDPNNEAIRAIIRAWKSAGVPVLRSSAGGHYTNLGHLFSAEQKAVDLCETLPTVLAIGEHPALDRLVSQLPPQFPAKRITVAEAAQLLAPPEPTSGE